MQFFFLLFCCCRSPTFVSFLLKLCVYTNATVFVVMPVRLPARISFYSSTNHRHTLVAMHRAHTHPFNFISRKFFIRASHKWKNCWSSDSFHPVWSHCSSISASLPLMVQFASCPSAIYAWTKSNAKIFSRFFSLLLLPNPLSFSFYLIQSKCTNTHTRTQNVCFVSNKTFAHNGSGRRKKIVHTKRTRTE